MRKYLIADLRAMDNGDLLDAAVVLRNRRQQVVAQLVTEVEVQARQIATELRQRDQTARVRRSQLKPTN